MLCESTGEARVTSELVMPDRTVALEETAEKLWLRIIREGFAGKQPRIVERRFR
jgi:hypothetical protein